MKLYIVTADTYYIGDRTMLCGIYEDETKAKERQKKVEEAYGNSTLTDVDVNSDCDIFLDRDQFVP